RALLAERGHPHGFERRFIGSGLDHAREFAFEGGNVECGSVVHRCLADRVGAQTCVFIRRDGGGGAGFSPGAREGQAASAAFALSTIASNAAGSWMARSDSTLRSTTTPALSSPEMNRL